jgi:hypothetical protein
VFRSITPRLILVSFALLIAAIVFPAAAAADRESFRPIKSGPRTLVFDVKKVDPAEIRKAVARLRVHRAHGRSRPVSKKVTRKVRLAAQRNNRLRLRSNGGRKGKLTVIVEDTPTEPAPAPTPDPTPPAAGDFSPTSSLGPVPADALYVAPNGSDSASGTRQDPLQTLAEAGDVARPGDTVVLLPGTYGALGVTQDMSHSGTAAAPITYRGEPGGPMPRILGHVRISGSYQHFNYLLFDGPTGQIKPPTSDNPGGEQVQVTVIGDAVNGIEISDSEIRDSHWHAGIFASTANDIRITGNYIHHNGDPNDPGQENMSHGVYFARGSGLIANNVIADNVARGVQLYQGPHDVTIANNTIVGNGKSGIQFGNETSNSTAVNNIVAYNGEYGIRSSSLTGSGNSVRRNLIWENGTADWRTLTDGLGFADNLNVDPGFEADSNFRLPGSSPAVDSALTAYAPATDFTHAGRTGAGPDLGAFEVR